MGINSRLDMKMSEGIEFYAGRDSYNCMLDPCAHIIREAVYDLDGKPHGKRFVPEDATHIHELFDVQGSQYLVFTMVCSAGEVVLGRACLPKGRTIDYLWELLGA